MKAVYVSPALSAGLGNSPGKTITQPAFHADVMPTLCALTGADAGSPLGTDLSPVLLGKNPLCMTGSPWSGQGEATAAR